MDLTLWAYSGMMAHTTWRRPLEMRHMASRMSVSILSNAMLTVEKIVDARAVLDMLNNGILLPAWKMSMKSIKSPPLRPVNHEVVPVQGIMARSIQIANLCTRAWFKVVDNLAVHVLVVTSFIDRCICSDILHWAKIVPWHWRPAVILCTRRRRWIRYLLTPVYLTWTDIDQRHCDGWASSVSYSESNHSTRLFASGIVVFTISIDYLDHSIRPRRLKVPMQTDDTITGLNSSIKLTELRRFIGFWNLLSLYVPSSAGSTLC